jgi:fatty acid hydroxylase domain-containing protein 2
MSIDEALFGGALGRAWASHVDAWAPQYGDDTPIVVGFLLMLVTYWSYGGLLLIVDVFQWPEWLHSRRHQPARPYSLKGTSYNPPFSALLKNVLINQFLVILPGTYALQHLFKPLGLGVYVSRELPSLSEFALALVVGPLAVEVGFYYSHWALHQFKYDKIHKIHHDYKAPHALAAIYAHPIEALVGNTICVIGPAFLLRWHLLIFYAGVVIGWIFTCNGHSGYSLPWATSKGGFRDFHDYHHEIFKGNYGTFGLLDRFHKTDLKWRAHCEKIKAEKAKQKQG